MDDMQINVDKMSRTKEPVVTIGIPTYNRSKYLSEAIESCSRQTFRSFEVIISDDSTNPSEQKQNRSLADAFQCRYFYNQVPLRQALNINQLIVQSRGQYFLLLHDDDLLEDSALELLLDALKSEPDIGMTYGKILVVDQEGKIIQERTNEENKNYFRSAEYSGNVHPEWAALVQQVPPNAFMLKTELAKSVLMNPEKGNTCDLDFCVRVALACRNLKFKYVDLYTSRYRTGHESITTGLAMTNNYAFDIYSENSFSSEFENLRQQKLTLVAPRIFLYLVRAQEFHRAIKVYSSLYFPWQKRLLPLNLILLVLCFLPLSFSRMILSRLEIINHNRRGKSSIL